MNIHISLLICGLALARPVSHETRRDGPTDLDTRRAAFQSDATSLAAALISLSRQIGVNIVADDVPHLTPASIAVDGTARQALDAITHRFDTGWSQTKRGEIIVQKRFDEPTEHPQIHRTDSVEIAHSILSALRSTGLRPNADAIATELRGLYATLTPQQMQEIGSGHDLPVRGLSLQQRLAVYNSTIHAAFGRVFNLWEQLESQLRGIDRTWLEPGPGPMPLSVDPASAAAELHVRGELWMRYVWHDKLKRCWVPFPHVPGGSFGQYPRDSSLLGGSNDQEPSGVGDETSKRLGTVISLPQGETTLSATTASLSEQTGVQIEASECLRDHRLILAIDRLSASGTLGLICEMNDWVYHEDRPGHVLIGRKRARRPGRIAELFDAVRSALPNDWRRFLTRASPTDAPPSPRDLFYKNSGLYEGNVILPAQRKRIAEIVNTLSAGLRLSLSDSKAPRKLAYASMTDQERERLLIGLVLDTLEQFSDCAGAVGILWGNLAPFQIDPETAVIRVKNGGISVLSIEDKPGAHVERGFGASLTPN